MTAGITTDGHAVISGEAIFRLKDTDGFPLSCSFSECAARGWVVDWVGLVNAARAHGWWDFQTMDAINEAFTDSGAWPEQQAQITSQLQRYILSNPIAR